MPASGIGHAEREIIIHEVALSDVPDSQDDNGITVDRKDDSMRRPCSNTNVQFAQAVGIQIGFQSQGTPIWVLRQRFDRRPNTLIPNLSLLLRAILALPSDGVSDVLFRTSSNDDLVSHCRAENPNSDRISRSTSSNG